MVKNNMKIKRSIKSKYVSQKFGESLACVKLDSNGRAIRPFIVKSKVNGVSPEGWADFYRNIGMRGHNGIDRPCWNGEPIYFNVEANTEWWSRSYVDSDGGLGIDIFSSDRIHIHTLPPQTGRLARREWEANNRKLYVKFRYHHLLKSEKGDAIREISDGGDGFFDQIPNVRLGELIALGDNTGASSGAHLHDSMKFVCKNSMTLDADNGYYGAVDYSMFYEDEFVVDYLIEEIEEEIEEVQLTLVDVLKRLIFELRQQLMR